MSDKRSFETSENLRKRKNQNLYPKINDVQPDSRNLHNFEGDESYSFHEDLENLEHSATTNHESDDNDIQEKGKRSLRGSVEELHRSNLKRKSECDSSSSSNSECDSTTLGPSDCYKNDNDTNEKKALLFFSSKPFFIFLLIFVILAAILNYFLFGTGGGKNDSQANNFDYMTEFVQDLNKMQQRYKMQDKKMWILIRSSVKSVLSNTDSTQPSVLLFLSSETARATSRSLAKSIAKTAGRAFAIRHQKTTAKKDDDVIRFGSIDCSKMANMEAGTVRHLINGALSEAFYKNKLNVAVLFDITRLPDSSPLILHEYCDNLNAPYKNVVLILTAVCSNETINNVRQTTKRWDLIGEECMRSILTENGFNEDKIGALLSRIANSVVIIVEEETETELES